MKRRGYALVAVMVLGSTATAVAATQRVAVVVGNNAGSGEQPPLHYAETDAGKMARVLAELGGVDTTDLFLLQGRGVATLKDTLVLAKKRVASYHQDPANRVILIFYFSGHSDGEAFELGPDRLTFSDLRRWLATTGAEVRLALVDSCKSGALLAAKGGKLGPAFQIRLTDELSSTGEALLASSAADEIALESREIGGSFFTHHFVSGLRGPADSSGDGMVTLSEAYQYAYAHTLATTGNTMAGPQHPAYDYRLSGQGELVLTELAKPSAMLELPKGFERALVIELARDQVIAELTSDARSVVAVPPGRYAVRAWRKGRAFAGRLAVTPGNRRVVRWDELSAMATSVARSKGDFDGSALTHVERHGGPGAAPSLQVAVGGQGGVASDLGVLNSFRLGIRSATPSGFSLAAQIGTGTGPGFRETSGFLFGGYRLGWERGNLGAWAGLELGGGVVFQSPDAGASAATGAVAIAPCAGVSWRVGARFSVVLEGNLPVTFLRRDNETAAVFLPALWLGALVAL